MNDTKTFSEQCLHMHKNLNVYTFYIADKINIYLHKKKLVFVGDNVNIMVDFTFLLKILRL